jgi:hypothetical protein
VVCMHFGEHVCKFISLISAFIWSHMSRMLGSKSSCLMIVCVISDGWLHIYIYMYIYVYIYVYICMYIRTACKQVNYSVRTGV